MSHYPRRLLMMMASLTCFIPVNAEMLMSAPGPFLKATGLTFGRRMKTSKKPRSDAGRLESSTPHPLSPLLLSLPPYPSTPFTYSICLQLFSVRSVTYLPYIDLNPCFRVPLPIRTTDADLSSLILLRKSGRERQSISERARE